MKIERINYHHLFYFWMVVREGGVAKASRALGLSQPTISGQVKALEDALGEPLFTRAGRKLEPTEMGRVAERYADEIFALGRELVDTVRGRPTSRAPRLAVGVADAVPKILARRLLAPALAGPDAARLSVREDRPDRLFAALAIHELDLVLSDSPLGAGTSVRAFNHLLGESAVQLFAAPTLARRLVRRFPRGLDGAPFLLPSGAATLRRQLDAWFDRHDLTPNIVGEFDDTALIKSFGQAGAGVFAAPSAIARDLARQFQVRPIGKVEGITERFYAVSVERRITHPVVRALSRAARADVFA